MNTPAGPRGPSRLVINARAETVAQRPMFRAAFSTRRCLIPADGFFEWDRTRKPRQPWWFHRANGHPLAFAGLVDDHADEPPRFVIITVPAAGGVEQIHDRMPAIVAREAVDPWLFGTPRDARAVLDDAGVPLEAMPVSTAFNTSQYQGAIEPVALR
jgi:putative SOS response-associated peptidase YedK